MKVGVFCNMRDMGEARLSQNRREELDETRAGLRRDARIVPQSMLKAVRSAHDRSLLK